ILKTCNQLNINDIRIMKDKLAALKHYQNITKLVHNDEMFYISYYYYYKINVNKNNYSSVT
ncbi:12175_t:CDS:1, partial [Cetraspora pellucida]